MPRNHKFHGFASSSGAVPKFNRTMSADLDSTPASTGLRGCHVSCGWAITKALSHSLNIGLERAEQFKYDMGISSIDSPDNAIPKTIIESISPIVNEIKYALNLYQSKSDKKVDKVILSGGSALLINLPSYLSKILDLNVVAGNPWSKISYPVDLKPLLDEIAPRLAIAIGLALREAE